MTKFRICSDLHLEFDEDLMAIESTEESLSEISHKYLSPLKDDKDMYLIIAGDIHTELRDVNYAERLFGERFKHIYIVLGNHSYYGTYFIDNPINNSDNVTVLENDVITTAEGVTIAGCILWTDMNKQHPLDMVNGQMFMNDYNYIQLDKYSSRRITPQHTVDESIKSYLWLERLSKIDIVVTHHLPSYDCVHAKYEKSDTNFCFASEYDELIEKISPQYWIFGHSHECMDFKKGNTRMINNSYGYPFEETRYQNNLIIEKS